LLDIPENSPGDLVSSQTDSATVDGFGIRPKAATPGGSKEITRFDVYPFALPTGGKRQDQGNELGKRKLAVSGKVRGRLPEFRINVSGD